MTFTEELATFCKKKGFMYPSSEIYGGLAGFYDYGHLGTRLKHNFENIWRKYFLSLNDNFHEIETANIMPRDVFKASGHLEKFADPVVNCSACGFKERADHFVERFLKKRVEGLTSEELTKEINKNKLFCPTCKSELEPVRSFNMMFPVQLGVAHKIYPKSVPALLTKSEEEQKNIAYLRPETAQSPYVNFKLQYELLRKRMPLGLALIGRAYRNEISPRNVTLRLREFIQAELQIFFNEAKINGHPLFEMVKEYKLRTVLIEDRERTKTVERTAQSLVQKGLPKYYVYHLVKIQQFYLEILKIPSEKFRFYQLNELERAFYNKYHFDFEVELQEHSFTEVGGLHYRTDHDLEGHQRVSQESMEVLDEETGKKFVPHVLELSFGVDRNVYALLDVNYENNKERGNIILHLPSGLTPFFCGIFPLVKNKPEIAAKAEEIYNDLKQQFSCLYDEAGSVGRRYARADEIGVEYEITIDFASLEDNSVTIRDRETTKQVRVKITQLSGLLQKLFAGKGFEDLGEKII